MVELFPIKIYKGSLIPSEEQKISTENQLQEIFNSCDKNYWTGESGFSTGQKNLTLYNDIDLSWFFEGIKNNVFEYWDSLNYQKMNIFIDSCWANLHRLHDTTTEHSHSDGFYGSNIISGVYYFKKPNGIGNIKFCNPLDYIIRMTPYKDMKGIDTISQEIVTDQYDYILFPSWLRHRVDPHPSNEERIAISFNYRGYN